MFFMACIYSCMLAFLLTALVRWFFRLTNIRYLFVIGFFTSLVVIESLMSDLPVVWGHYWIPAILSMLLVGILKGLMRDSDTSRQEKIYLEAGKQPDSLPYSNRGEVITPGGQM